MLNVVIFGSAASASTRDRARDVDVAYSGVLVEQPDATAERVAQMASRWASENGLGHLPLDIHAARSGSSKEEVLIPSPCGIPVPAIPLNAWTKVRTVPFSTLSAAVRAFGHEPRLLARHMPEQDRLAVIPAEHDGPDWEGYVSGLGALRRAIAKTPDPDATVDVLRKDYGQLLARLIDEDPQPDRDGLETLRGASPVAAGGAVTIVLLRGHAPRLQYGGIAPERLEALLYG
jgi:hypothetical protein